MSKIAGIYWDDTAAAPGISLSVYFSGCHFHCPGCHNPEAWDFNYGEEFTSDKLQEIISKLRKNNIERRISILGGEPLCDENLADVALLINSIKTIYPDTLIYVWTGYTYEELIKRNIPLLWNILKQVNVLIDGRYEQDKRDITLPLRGSTNQRVIYLENGNVKQIL